MYVQGHNAYVCVLARAHTHTPTRQPQHTGKCLRTTPWSRYLPSLSHGFQQSNLHLARFEWQVPLPTEPSLQSQQIYIYSSNLTKIWPGARVDRDGSVDRSSRTEIQFPVSTQQLTNICKSRSNTLFQPSLDTCTYIHA